MKKSHGLGILALGVIGLGWWAHGHDAKRIEAMITTSAAAVMADTVHGATAQVSGRDILVQGIVDGPDEASRLREALDAVPGRRVVSLQEAQVLEKASPFVTEVIKAEDGAISASGLVPTEALRASLAPALGGAETALTLAAGAPEGWGGAAAAGLAALGQMVQGKMSLSDGVLSLSGTVLGPDQQAAVQAALAALPADAVKTDLRLLDDGTPAAFDLSYDAANGASLQGKLPKGMTAQALMAALGLPALADQSKQALLGEAGNAADYAGLAAFLPRIETLLLKVSPEGRRAEIGFGAEADLGALKDQLAAALPGVETTLSVASVQGQNGARRMNAASGTEQRLMGGFWVDVPQLDLTIEGCTTTVDSYLADNTINFLSGSDQLDASAIAVINHLAGIMARCNEEVGLQAAIGGHTDNQGDPAANLGLSQRRAVAVRRELVARGVAETALTSLGYGDSQPIADNATEEGRAKNRRTTITWTK